MSSYFNEISEQNSINPEQFDLITQNPFSKMKEEKWIKYKNRDLLFSENPYYESEQWKKIKGFEVFALQFGFKMLYKVTLNNGQLPYIKSKKFIQSTYWCFNYPKKKFYIYIELKTLENNDTYLAIHIITSTNLKCLDDTFGILEFEECSFIPIPGWNVHSIRSDYFTLINQENSTNELNIDFFYAMKKLSDHSHRGFIKVEIPSFYYRDGIFDEILNWMAIISFCEKYEGLVIFDEPCTFVRYDFGSNFDPNGTLDEHTLNNVKKYRNAILFINDELTVIPLATRIIDDFMDFLELSKFRYSR